MYVCKYIVYVNMLGQRNYTPVRITTCSQKPQPQTNIKSNPDIELSWLWLWSYEGNSHFPSSLNQKKCWIIFGPSKHGSSADKLAKNHRKVLPEWNMEGVFLSKLQPLQLPIKTSPPNNRKMAPSQVTLGLLPAQRWRPAETLRGVFGERNFWKNFWKWGILPSENAIFWKVSSQQNLDLFSSSSTKEFDRYMDKSISEYISE